MDLTFTRISRFPDPLGVDESGIVAVGGDLSVETLCDAYYHGIFPWPHEGYPLLWFAPIERGVLEFKKLHISKSLQKLFNKSDKNKTYAFTHNKAFKEVVENCALLPRKNQKGTWINNDIKKSYYKFHKAGFAHSFELWEGKDLIAGMYGVYIKNVFSGESIFGLKANVSKICFIKVIEQLKLKNVEWMDVQMITEFTKSMGAELISNKEFILKLNRAHKKN